MFYSHEILTDRKHGVATIWLVATLGSKSSLRKITRKAIMEVDVPNACETITDPEAPMALRLQGSLLFGLSKVFNQQCAYVLTDMLSLRDKMRSITLLLKELETDPDVATTRPEQLNLQADPGFNIDLDLGFDLSSFDTSFSASEPSSQLSPRTLASTNTSFLEDEDLRAELEPLDNSLSHRAEDGFAVADDDFVNGGLEKAGGSKQASEVAAALRDDDLVYQNPEFDIGEDGDILMRDTSVQNLEHSEQVNASEAIVGDEDEDDFILDAGVDELSPTAMQISRARLDDGPVVPGENGADGQVVDSVERANSEAEQQEQTETVTGTAPHRNTKTKTIPIDDPSELPNRILAEWNNNYLDFMAEAHLENAGKISIAQAKCNAAYWVLDQGIGGVDSAFREDVQDHPLAVFSGQALLDALVGPQSRKRSASVVAEEEEEDSSEGRRVRARSGNEQAAPQVDHGEQNLADDEQGLLMGDDDIEPEIGREQQAPLSDRLSDMPWNTYAASSQQGSRHGSVRPLMSAARASSSVGGPAAFDFVPPSSRGNRLSRLIAESPLEQRRQLLRQASITSGAGQRGEVGTPSAGEDDFTMGDIADDELDKQLAGNMSESFELHGPAAAVSTQEAASSQWLAATLEQEAANFLLFVHDAIRKKQKGKDGGAQDDAGNEGEQERLTSAIFEELVPPERNTNLVAAQGLLHVLSLATKALISVQQEEGFGDIKIGLAESGLYSDGGEEGIAA